MNTINETSSLGEQKERLLLLIRQDSRRLHERITERFDDYMRTFALKRTRVHFQEIFENRYRDLKILDLQKLSSELIASLDQFYAETDKFSWYLNHTEDMPASATEKSMQYIKSIKNSFSTLSLFLEAELQNEKGEG